MISLFVGGDVALLLHKFLLTRICIIATANFRIQVIRIISYEHSLSMLICIEKALPTASGRCENFSSYGLDAGLDSLQI